MSFLFIVEKKVTGQEPPKFIIRLLSYKLVSVGDSFTLKGEFSGNPKPKIEWLKNGEVF
jgi:hypothetical protein